MPSYSPIAAVTSGLRLVEAGVGDGVAGGEIVAAVEHDVPVGDQRARVGLVEPPLDLDHFDMRIEARDRLRGAVDLLAADVAGRVQHLAMQIGERDDVVVDDPERADAGAGEILQRRRAEPAGPDRQRARRLELVLPRPADAAQHDLPRIALDLFLAEFHRSEFTRRRDGGANAALHAAPSVLRMCVTHPPRNGSWRVDRVAEPLVERDVLNEAGVGVEPDFAIAHRRREPLGVRHQSPPETATLTGRRHRDVFDQQRLGFGDRLDQRDDPLALAQKVDAMVADRGVEVGRHRLRLAADDGNPLGVGLARQIARRRRVGRGRAAKGRAFRPSAKPWFVERPTCKPKNALPDFERLAAPG